MVKTKVDSRIKWIGAIIIFIICFYSAYSISMGKAPDEEMRYQIPYFIYKYNYLPNGSENEVINNIWGFSYGFTPYLPSLISVVFMKIVSVFTNSQGAILLSARMVSVISATVTWIFCCKIGERLFKKNKCNYIV